MQNFWVFGTMLVTYRHNGDQELGDLACHDFIQKHKKSTTEDTLALSILKS